MSTIFSKIAAGEIPSYKCAESEKFYAFLDINPVTKGHTLVIPRKEVDYIFDMDDADLAEFEVFAKRVARALRQVAPPFPRFMYLRMFGCRRKTDARGCSERALVKIRSRKTASSFCLRA